MDLNYITIKTAHLLYPLAFSLSLSHSIFNTTLATNPFCVSFVCIITDQYFEI